MGTKKKHTIKKENNISGTGRVCPVCKGTGLDKNVHYRYTILAGMMTVHVQGVMVNAISMKKMSRRQYPMN